MNNLCCFILKMYYHNTCTYYHSASLFVVPLIFACWDAFDFNCTFEKPIKYTVLSGPWMFYYRELLWSLQYQDIF